MFALLIALIYAIQDSDYGSFDRYDTGNYPESSNCNEIEEPPEEGVDASQEYKFSLCRSSSIRKKITLTGTSVGRYAFYKCNIITSVTLPDTLQTIKVGAFARCPSLTEVKNFPESMTQINDGAFYLSGLESIPTNIPVNLQTIGPVAFAECSSLSTALTITNRASKNGKTIPLTIGSGSFYNTKVLIPQNIQSFVSVGNSAFENCKQGSSLRVVTFHGKGSIGNEAFKGCRNLNLVLAKDSEITSIGNYAFQNTATSGTPTFPDDLETIGNHAYENTQISGNLNFNNVESIGEYAFANVKGIGKIEVPLVYSFGKAAFLGSGVNGAVVFYEYLISIGVDAFAGTGVSDLTIPRGSISQGAFEGCKSLGSVTYGEGITYSRGTISKDAFKDAVIKSLTLISSTLSSNSFEQSIIEDVKITNSIIQNEAFLRANIKTLTIIDPESRLDDNFGTQTIVGGAFSACEIQTSINLTDVKEVGDNAFYGLSKRYSPTLTFNHDPSIEVDSETYSIGNYAFAETTIILNNPSFNNTYAKIGEYAFAGCNGVTGDIYLNVNEIGDYAFSKCNLNGNVKLDADTAELPTTDDICHLFEGCDLKTFDISNYTHGIPARLFHGMTHLTGDLVISDKITSIGSEAFLGCDLTSITIEENPQAGLTIGSRAFYKCKKMQTDNLNLLRSISIISEFAFYQCEGIKGVTFSPTITNIQAYAFAQTGLKSLQLPRLLSSIGEGAFKSCTSLTNNLDIPDTVTSIPGYAFYDCPFSNGKLTNGYHLTEIDEYAFYRCKFSGHLIVPRIESIGSYAFYDCSNLQSLEFYDLYSMTSTPSFSIGESAFKGCTGLTGPLPIKYCNSIDKNAFYGCSGLTGGLDFSDSGSLDEIGDYAFYGCTSLNGELNFKEGLEEINQYAFCGCTNLIGSLNFPSTLTTIGDYAFQGCNNLNGELHFESSGPSSSPSIISIGQYAFNGCSKLNGTLNLENVVLVGSHAFAGCTGLSGPLTFGTNLGYIGTYAFEGCTGFSESLTFYTSTIGTSGTSLLNIDRGAFKDCTGFKDGLLIFDVAEVERTSTYPVYKFRQFLKIQNEAFENTKFKNIYYNGRFEPDCDLDIGISGNKGIKTSSHYANKSFCGNPLHHNKLSGGAIAGIVIACIVVVALIVFLIVFFILKNKKNKDNSEAEVEMNQDP